MKHWRVHLIRWIMRKSAERYLKSCGKLDCCMGIEVFQHAQSGRVVGIVVASPVTGIAEMLQRNAEYIQRLGEIPVLRPDIPGSSGHILDPDTGERLL